MKDTILILNCLIEPPYGGIAKYMTYLLPRVRNGSKFIGLTARSTPNNQNNLVFENIELINITPKNPLIILWYLCRYFSLILNFGKKYGIPFRHAIKIVYYWLPESERILKSRLENIKYIHAIDNPNMQGTVAAYLSNKYGIPYLITTFGELVPHVDPVQRYDDYSSLFLKQTTDILRNAYRIGSITKYCISLLREFNIDTHKVHLFYPVVDIAKYSRKYDYQHLLIRYPQLTGKQIILFVGQIQPRKAPHLIVEAIAPLPRDLLDQYRFVFVGKDHGYKQFLEDYIRDNNLVQYSLLTGALDESDLLAFYSLADIFIFPTVSKIECLGLVFIQAMFSQCAVIASNISGVPEVITDGENGLLFTPGDTKGLREKLLLLMEQPETIKQLGLNGYHSAVKQFEEEEILNNYTSFYD